MTNINYITAEEAAKSVRSGDRVYIGTSSSFAYELVDALYDRKDELEDVTLLCSMSITPCRMFNTDWPADIPAGRKGNPFIFDTFFLGAGERGAHRKHNMAFEFTSFHLSQIDLWMREIGCPDISFLQVSRPDESGRCSFGSSGICDHKYVVEETKRGVYLESNTGSPYIFGQDNLISLDHEKVAGVLLTDHNAPELMPDKIDDVSRQISQIVVQEVPDGATLQLGLGKMSTAIGYDLKQRNDLGIFSELFSQPMMMLMKNGNVTNRCKGFMDGMSVFSFSAGTQEMYDFMDHNPEIYGAPFPFVNDARNIAKNSRMLAPTTRPPSCAFPAPIRFPSKTVVPMASPVIKEVTVCIIQLPVDTAETSPAWLNCPTISISTAPYIVCKKMANRIGNANRIRGERTFPRVK